MTLIRRTVLLPFLVLSLTTCGGGSGGGASNLGDQVDSLNSTAKTFIDKEQAFQNFDLTTATEDNLMDPLDEYMAAAEAFETEYRTFVDSREAYLEDLGVTTDSRIAVWMQGTADPQLAIQIGQLVEQGNTKGQECKGLLDAGKFDEAQDCMNTAKKQLTAAAFRVGTSALVGGGTAAVTGLAIAAAPVTISVVAATGITIGVGVVAGLVWDWCTAPSSPRLRAQSSDLQECHFASRSTSFVGETKPIAMTSLPQGTGTITINIPGHAPIVREVTIGASGIHITLHLAADDADPADIKTGIEDTETSDTPETPDGVTCADVSSIFATPSPTDPGPGEGVSVTATVFPPLSGCTVEFDVSGTDGYSDSGTPTSDSAGTISFYIPGGAEGIVDTVTVSSGSADTTITYTF